MYSNSRLETFEQCRRKYRFRYIDNIRTEQEGVEAFVGKRVHETLERLYRDLRVTKLDSLEELLSFYESAWEKNWHGKVSVTREGLSPGNYFAYGQQCIQNYYRRFHPFDQSKTLGLEERIELTVRDGDKEYALQGYIDRLAWIPETQTYEIHDYKTGGAVPTQEDADQDRQLALYQLGIMQRWPDAKNFRLIWHYLATDKDLVSSRSATDLESLERDVVGAIKAIEAEKASGRWDVRISRLCDWCEYKSLCPAFKHTVAMEAVAPNVYLQDDGVQLVQKYTALEDTKADLQAQLQAVQGEQKKLDEAILAYGEKNGLLALDGPEARLTIKVEDEFKVPRKGEDPFAWELLRNTLKNAGKLEDVSTVNANMLKFAMKKGKWPETVVKSILGLITQSVQKSIALVRK